jgi:hypothetical protein
MVFSFFRSGDQALDHVDHEVASMLRDCRHSLDLALTSICAGGEDITALGEEIRATDRRINASEETVRRDLIVHTAVQGGSDVGSVMSSVLAVKKLERMGDQAKNIFDLAAEGVRFTGSGDADELRALGTEVSTRLGEAAGLLGEPTEPAVRPFLDSCQQRMDDLDRRVNELIHSDAPARVAVPRAMYFRYLKRILANVAGALEVFVQPVDRPDRDE